MVPKGCDNKRFKVSGCDVLRAHLNDAWRLLPAGREKGSEAQVVSEDYMSRRIRPCHDLRIRSPRVPDVRPMDRFPTVTRKNRHPLGGEVHIDNQLHGTDRGTSISSARHAAYDNASRMSSASR